MYTPHVSFLYAYMYIYIYICKTVVTYVHPSCLLFVCTRVCPWMHAGLNQTLRVLHAGTTTLYVCLYVYIHMYVCICMYSCVCVLHAGTTTL